MRTFTWSNLRQQSHWLVLANSFLIVVGVVVLTLIWPASSRVGLADEAGLDKTISLGGGYQSPERCRECHETEFQDWSNTSHAKALFDPIFQVYLQQVEQPGKCFACHATGYDTATGQFVLAGVTCEACHGPYRSDHPEQPMTVINSEMLCGTCHAGTLDEWRSSRHGQMGVNCLDCHEVHTQQTRAVATTNALCVTCHLEQLEQLEQLEDDTHTIHIEADVHCVDCHLSRPDDDRGALNGRAITGHSFAVFVKTCNTCHAESSLQLLNFGAF